MVGVGGLVGDGVIVGVNVGAGVKVIVDVGETVGTRVSVGIVTELLQEVSKAIKTNAKRTTSVFLEFLGNVMVIAPQ
jgi:prefoldin subunit 5